MSQHSKPTILVVDDEFDCCQNLADILCDLNYDVDTACGGAVALELAQSKQYDVALLDLKMPGMDGLTLYRRIRKMQPGTVAFIVTAYASDPTTLEALHAGACQVISKPIDLAALLPLVDDAVKQPLVLVVDDDEALCDNLWEILRDRRLRVSVAHSEQEAVRHLTSQDYQVVFVDLKLPDGDGRNVLRMLEEGHPECRTVLITGHPGEYEDVISAALNHGADAVCYKPFDLRELLATIERLVRRNGPQE